jgi:hypothetical protein
VQLHTAIAVCSHDCSCSNTHFLPTKSEHGDLARCKSFTYSLAQGFGRNASLVKAASTTTSPAKRGKRGLYLFQLHLAATLCKISVGLCCSWRYSQTMKLSSWLRGYASSIAHRQTVAAALSWNGCTSAGCCSRISPHRLSGNESSLSASIVFQSKVVVHAGTLMWAFCTRDIALLQTSKAHAAWICEAVVDPSNTEVVLGLPRYLRGFCISKALP